MKQVPSPEPEEFTAQERAYLESLPVVRSVTATRIYYTDWFRDQATARYLAGESPVELFRGAGLDPKLVGYKRIERAFSRWKQRAAKRSGEKGRDWPLTPSNDGTRVDAIMDRMKDFDERDRIIARQAIRIDQLEQQLNQLREQLTTSQTPEGEH